MERKRGIHTPRLRGAENPVKGICYPLREFAPLRLQLVVFDFAADGLPEVAELLGDLVAQGPMCARSFLREKIADVDAEDFLVLTNRALVVDENEGLPSEMVAKVKHADSGFQFVKLAGEAGECLPLDLVKLLDPCCIERR